MQGWIKHFIDGESEVGSDSLVRRHQASWTHGRHDGLCAVDLHFKEKIFTLSCGVGEYWQSDTMIACMMKGASVPGQMVTRRISRKITAEDIGKKIYKTSRDDCIKITFDRESDNSTIINTIKTTHVNQWLVLEVSIREENKLHIVVTVKKERI